MTETVPDDIAAAIEVYTMAVRIHERATALVARRMAVTSARAGLDAAILTHLRKADEMKAALERITSGGV